MKATHIAKNKKNGETIKVSYNGDKDEFSINSMVYIVPSEWDIKLIPPGTKSQSIKPVGELESINIGYCEDCGWRDGSGSCVNEKKIHEDLNDYSDDPQEDHLVYSYYEDGGFWVGPKFGCVHFKEKAKP